MSERIIPFRSILPHSTPIEQTIPFRKKPEILANMSGKEVARIAAGTALVLLGCAVILDGRINNNNFETIAGATIVIGGIIVLTR